MNRWRNFPFLVDSNSNDDCVYYMHFKDKEGNTLKFVFPGRILEHNRKRTDITSIFKLTVWPPNK